MSYDEWKTTEPTDYGPGTMARWVECAFCAGVGALYDDGEDDDVICHICHICHICDGEGEFLVDKNGNRIEE